LELEWVFSLCDDLNGYDDDDGGYDDEDSITTALTQTSHPSRLSMLFISSSTVFFKRTYTLSVSPSSFNDRSSSTRMTAVPSRFCSLAATLDEQVGTHRFFSNTLTFNSGPLPFHLALHRTKLSLGQPLSICKRSTNANCGAFASLWNRTTSEDGNDPLTLCATAVPTNNRKFNVCVLLTGYCVLAPRSPSPLREDVSENDTDRRWGDEGRRGGERREERRVLDDDERSSWSIDREG